VQAVKCRVNFSTKDHQGFLELNKVVFSTCRVGRKSEKGLNVRDRNISGFVISTILIFQL
jgi:hypothetical protein